MHLFILYCHTKPFRRMKKRKSSHAALLCGGHHISRPLKASVSHFHSVGFVYKPTEAFICLRTAATCVGLPLCALDKPPRIPSVDTTKRNARLLHAHNACMYLYFCVCSFLLSGYGWYIFMGTFFMEGSPVRLNCWEWMNEWVSDWMNKRCLWVLPLHMMNTAVWKAQWVTFTAIYWQGTT